MNGKPKRQPSTEEVLALLKPAVEYLTLQHERNRLTAKDVRHILMNPTVQFYDSLFNKPIKRQATSQA